MRMSNFKYTIVLIFVIAFVLWIFTAVAKSNNECKDKGGTYVSTFGGWECVQKQ